MRQILFLITFTLLFSCKKEIKKELAEEFSMEVISDTLIDSEAAFFSKGINGTLLLNWTEETEKGNVLTYKSFQQNAFGEKKTVLPSFGMQSHHESMAKIAQTKSGIFYTFFRIKTPSKKNKYGGSLYYTISIDQGVTWGEKIKLVSDEKSSSQSFYDVAVLPDGELGICWLDNRFSTREKRGSTLFFSKTDGVNGVLKEKAIAFGTCQCCRTDLSVVGNRIEIAFRNIIEGNIRDMFYLTSTDNGLNFSDGQRISNDNWEIDGCPHTGPSLAGNKNKTAVVWFSAGEGNKGIFFTQKFHSDEKFNPRKEISEEGTHPQMLAVKEQFYVVYDEYYSLEETTYQHIKLQLVNPLGMGEIISLTKEKTMNSHPIISKIDATKIMVAWTNLDGNKKKIQTKIIKL